MTAIYDWSEALLTMKSKIKELNHALLMRQNDKAKAIVIDIDVAAQQLYFFLEREDEKNPPDGGEVPRPQ